MRTPPLSQAELNSLLTGRLREEDAAVSEVSRRALAERLQKWTRPTEADATAALDAAGVLLRHVRALHQRCAPRLAAALSTGLRAAIEVRLRTVERGSFGAFLLTHERAACFVPLQTLHYEPGWALEIELALLYPLIDRLLGGGTAPNWMPDRPLTELEKRLTERVAQLLLAELNAAWDPVQPWGLAVQRVEHQVPAQPLLTAPACLCAVRFELSFAPARGDVTVVMPWSSLERVDAGAWSHVVEHTEPAGGAADTVEVSAILPEVELPAAELQDLQVGDVIATERAMGDLWEVRLNGVTRFRARPGIADGRKAIRLE
jgi:flagellar motor switch protein FliM